MTIDELIDRRVPAALICALLLQAATAVWWVAAKNADDHFQFQRLDHMELRLTQSTEDQAHIAERLARIEERQTSEIETLHRIERQTGGGRH